MPPASRPLPAALAATLLGLSAFLAAPVLPVQGATAATAAPCPDGFEAFSCTAAGCPEGLACTLPPIECQRTPDTQVVVVHGCLEASQQGICFAIATAAYVPPGEGFVDSVGCTAAGAVALYTCDQWQPRMDGLPGLERNCHYDTCSAGTNGVGCCNISELQRTCLAAPHCSLLQSVGSTGTTSADTCNGAPCVMVRQGTQATGHELLVIDACPGRPAESA